MDGVCSVDAILDNRFTELVFRGLLCLPFGCIIFDHCQYYGKGNVNR